MRKKEFAAKVWSKLVLHDREHRLLERGDRVLAAVSGGPDSVCLAHFLSVFRRRRGFALTFLHVHHGLRGIEADADLRFVEALGRKLEVPVVSVRVRAAERAARRRKGLEDAGRELRYEEISRVARELKCGKAATAHQLDDQAETVILHMLRGTKLSALGGIPPRRALARGVVLIRPLLPISREEVTEYLRVHGLRSRLDKSNLSAKFTRNWVRREIIPRLAARQPQVREHLAGLAAQVRALDKP